MIIFLIAVLFFFSGCTSDKRADDAKVLDSTSKPEPLPPLAVGPRDDTAVDAHSGASTQHASASDVPPPAAGEGDTALVASLLRYQHRDIALQRNKPVVIVRSGSAEDAAMALMKKLAPELEPGIRVLIKPNLGGFTWFSNGADNGMIGRTTSPAFVEGIILYLRSKGITDIVIAEGWGVESPSDVEKLFRVSGMSALAARYPGTRVLDLNYYGGAGPDDALTKPMKVPMPTAVHLKDDLVLPRVYVDYLLNGLVINAPVLKTHRFALVSAGMKNLMGVLGIAGEKPAHRNKGRMHRELNDAFDAWKKSGVPMPLADFSAMQRVFAERLADVYAAARPHLTLIDGTLALEGDGFDRVRSVPLGAAVGSYNTVYADAVAAQIVGAADSKELKKITGYNIPATVAEAMTRYYPEQTLSQIKVWDPSKIRERSIRLRIDSMGGEVPGNMDKVFAAPEPMDIPRIADDISGLEALLRGWSFDDAAWVGGDWRGESLPPGVNTRISVARNETHLLVFFSVGYRQLTPHAPAGDTDEISDLYDFDVVEAFIDPDPSTPQTYLEFELDPLGRTLDIRVDLSAGQFDSAFDSGMKTAVVLNRDQRSWIAVMAIPFGPDFPAPAPAAAWKGNFFRIEGAGDDRLYMALRPTGTAKPSFHVPASFGTLLFK